MLTCPFCGFDYSDHGLREGRCPSCGSVVSWESGSGDVPKEVQAAILAQTMQLIRPARPAVVPPNGERESSGSERAAQVLPLPTPESRATPGTPTPSAASPPLGPDQTPPLLGPRTASDAKSEVGTAEGRLEAERSPGAAGGLFANNPGISSDILRTIMPAHLSPDQVQDVSSAWKEATDQSGTHPRHTLKGRGTRGVSDTHLVIQTRSVAQRLPNTSLPVSAEYELLDVIGKGGVGVVYLARQSSIDRDVAIKMLRTDRADEPGNRDKFLAEAVVTGDLDHPNIVPIYDLGNDPSGALFYSMKRVQGTPWNDVIGKKKLSENLDILLKVSDAIAFAHARGVVHRDLKPENVMLGDFGEVLVMDWGIALPLPSYGKQGGILRSQGLGGSPAYMAPEMVTGPLERIGPTSDVYLLGALLYEILTGYPPHTGRDVRECLMAAARNEIAPTSKSGELLEIALRALATRAEDRYPSVLAFQAAIRSYESHAESIVLSSRAAHDLAQAAETESYDDYSRAVFAFQESIALWDGNKSARAGLVDAKEAYARCALKKGDFDLGLSLLDPTLAQHATLYQELNVAAADRDARQGRLRAVKRMVALLLCLVFVGGAAALTVIYRYWNEAEAAQQVALDQQGIAEGQAKIAKQKEQAAREAAEEEKIAKDAAKRSANEAKKQRGIAEDEKVNAEDARQGVEETSYFSEINVIASKIKENLFGQARDTLIQQRDGAAEDDQGSRKSRYRHWEWGRQWFLCRGDEVAAGSGVGGDGRRVAVVTQTAPWPIEVVALAPDDQVVAVGGRGGEIELWSVPPVATQAGVRLATVQHPDGVGALAFSGDGRFVACGGAKSGIVKIWRRSEGGQLQEVVLTTAISHGRQIRSLAFSPSPDQSLLTVADDNTIHRWQVRVEGSAPTATKVRSYRGHLDRVWSASFSHHGRWIVSGSEDSTVRLWDAELGKQLVRFDGHIGGVFAVAFAPDDRWIASVGYDKRVLLRKVPDDPQGAQPRDTVAREIEDDLAQRTAPPNFFALLGHSDSIRTVDFSRTGERLVTAGQDNTAIVWNFAKARAAAESALATGGQASTSGDAFLEKTLRSHGTWIKSCAVTGDGKWVVTGSSDETWRRWDVDAYNEVRVLHDADSNAVLSARFLPGGHQVVTALADGTVRHWDAETGLEIGKFHEGHDFLTTTGIFFRDGKRVATAAGDETVRVWDIKSGIQSLCLKGTGRRGVVALSNDGSRILTGGDHKTAKWWDATSGELLLTLQPYARRTEEFATSQPDANLVAFRRGLPEITAVAVSPDARLLLTGDSEGRAWLWDVANRQVKALTGGHGKAISSIFFVSDYPWARQRGLLAVTVGQDGRVIQWTTMGTERDDAKIALPDAIDACALSSDGVRFACAAALSEKKTGLWLWDLATGASDRPLEIPGEVVNAVAFYGKNEESILLTTTDIERSTPDLKLYSPEQTPALKPFSLAPTGAAPTRWGNVWAAAVSEDHASLLTVSGRIARLWDVGSGAISATFQPHGSVRALDVSPDGKLLVTAGGEGTVKLWSIESHQPVRVFPGGHQPGRPVRSVAFSPDGRWVLSAGDDGAVFLWDVERGEKISVGGAADDTALIRDPDAPSNVAIFSPDGARILTIATSRPPTVWRIEPKDNGTRYAAVKQFDLKPNDDSASSAHNVLSAAFSPNGKWIITGSDDSVARLWSSADGTYLDRLPVLSASVISVAFSADGFRALTGIDDGRAVLWDTRCLARRSHLGQRAPEADVDGDGAESASTGFHPREILTLSRHSATEVTTEATPVRETTHERPVTAVAFSPNGRDVLTASLDGMAIVWPGTDLPPALDLSRGKTDVPPDAAPRDVDPRAIVSYSTTLVSQPLSLSVSILAPDDKSDNGKQPWTLSLGDSHPAPLGQWRVQGTVIEYREADDRAWRQVGEVGGGASGAPLEIQLLPELPGHLLEPIVRGVSLSYSGSESMTVSAEFRLRWGADERSSVVWRPVWLMAKNGADEEAASAEAKASDEP